MMTGVARPRRIPLLVATLAAAMLVAVAQGGAQQGGAQTDKSDKKSPGLFKAQQQSREQPVKITSATLEVRDKSKIATFKGDVHVIQGETDVRCDQLVVFYDDEKDKSGAKKAPPSSSPDGTLGQQQIRRMEAHGSVIVTQKDQRAVGDRAEFDMRSNTVTLIGNVVITNAENVLRGSRMVVDLTTGVARMGETGSGRVEGIFNSKGPPPSAPKPGKQN